MPTTYGPTPSSPSSTLPIPPMVIFFFTALSRGQSVFPTDRTCGTRKPCTDRTSARCAALLAALPAARAACEQRRLIGPVSPVLVSRTRIPCGRHDCLVVLDLP